MNGMTRKAIGVSGLPLAILSLAMMSGARAAAAPAPAVASPPTAEQLVELDEIWIRGKGLSQQINEAEDAFFAAYNKVNRNYEFNITCGEVSLNPGSMIMRRVCVPGFVMNAFWGGRAGSTSRVIYTNCGYAAGGGMNGGLGMDLVSSCGGISHSIPPIDATPSAAALIAARSQELAVHMMMLINRDPQLKQMAGRLDDLHGEFQSMRTRYERIRPPEAKPVRPNRGPRAL